MLLCFKNIIIIIIINQKKNLGKMSKALQQVMLLNYPRSYPFKIRILHPKGYLRKQSLQRLCILLDQWPDDGILNMTIRSTQRSTKLNLQISQSINRVPFYHQKVHIVACRTLFNCGSPLLLRVKTNLFMQPDRSESMVRVQ